MTQIRAVGLVAVIVLLIAGCQPSQSSDAEGEAQTVPFEQNERIVFFGDSITEQGQEQPGGYVNLVRDSLKEAYPERNIEVIGAGISGNKVPDLLERVEEDVLAKDPSTVVIYIGINDVWHWKLNESGGTPKDAYRKGLNTLVDTLQQAGARVLLCTPSVIGEKSAGTNEQDEMLDEYAAISREVAANQHAGVCDLRSAFQDYLAQHNKENKAEGILTVDGVHLNEKGNVFVARQMINALKSSEEKSS